MLQSLFAKNLQNTVIVLLPSSVLSGGSQHPTPFLVFICYMYERSRKVSRKGSENLDKHLLEALYHRYYKELYIFVYSLCGSETVTDDILQDTFLKALLALKDSHTNMRAWLYMVARNLYYNYYNRQKNLFSIETEEVDRRNSREKIISGEGEAFIQNDILEEILHKEEKKRVWDAFSSKISLSSGISSCS